MKSKYIYRIIYILLLLFLIYMIYKIGITREVIGWVISFLLDIVLILDTYENN